MAKTLPVLFPVAPVNGNHSMCFFFRNNQLNNLVVKKTQLRSLQHTVIAVSGQQSSKG
jgi:hypothetical protein